MGASHSVSLVINLDRPNTFFFAGELVSGTANVLIKRDPVEINEIFLSLRGETGYAARRVASQENDGAITVASQHSLCFLLAKNILVRSEHQQNQLIFPFGQYSWRFEFSLPAQLPPSINTGKQQSHVRYYLELVMDKVWHKRYQRKALDLTVFPHVNLLESAQYLMAASFSHQNQQDVSLKGAISKQGYGPGETITGTIEIQNPRQIFLKKINLSLVQYYRIDGVTGKITIQRTTLPKIVQRNDQWMVEQFSCTIPAKALAPSYQFHGGFHQMVNVDIDYFLEFDVKAEGSTTNFVVFVPIMLATEAIAKPNQY